MHSCHLSGCEQFSSNNSSGHARTVIYERNAFIAILYRYFSYLASPLVDHTLEFTLSGSCPNQKKFVHYTFFVLVFHYTFFGWHFIYRNDRLNASFHLKNLFSKTNDVEKLENKIDFHRWMHNAYCILQNFIYNNQSFYCFTLTVHAFGICTPLPISNVRTNEFRRTLYALQSADVVALHICRTISIFSEGERGGGGGGNKKYLRIFSAHDFTSQ